MLYGFSFQKLGHEQRRDFGHDGVAEAFNRVAFQLEGKPIARQYAPEIMRQE